MPEGTVKRWDIVGGFGFIECDQYGEVFVHRSQVRDRSTLRKGMKVRFEVEQNRRGPKAINVYVISDSTIG